ncbi:helix-turn-helix domain-containing protein [Salinispora tropica]|uniref:Helix-turn-helix domain protein n=1 Tax=Salinispora tropica (strain ATCC BAA-916 / DSM 44818 / JCM 13857 / NBRC 105044 / CNB-440) TaxID=369723 RepID=A4X296_SALTO|nr:helix-turn-helix transcriptional regulator [Salinispora tropica]ABP52996.1 helix-turn-helix domain protein [Salinispora tropica CNB-440]
MMLRALREAAELSTAQVAEHLASSQPKVSRIENAVSPVSKGDLMLMLNLYGVTDPDEQDRHWQLARAGRERGWWESYRDVLTGSLGSYIGFENEAESLKIWSWGVFPGLLQTEAYARALFASDPVRTEPEEVDRLVAARMQRQQRIAEDGLNLWVVLDESLLHRQVGPPGVLAKQLERIAEPPPGVTVQVLPSNVGCHPGLSGAFTIMEFAEFPTIAYRETLTGDTPVEAVPDVGRYTLAFDHLRASALSPVESRKAAVSVTRELRKEQQ